MTYLSQLEEWVAANYEVLEEYGQVSFSIGRSGTDNQSAHLLLALSAESDIELLVWESGDAEFNRGSFTNSVYEHIELGNPEDLVVLLDRFMQTVTAGG